MPLYRAFLQTLGATVLLALALACHGKKSVDPATETSVTVSGTLTYLRVPLATDANGVPTGLKDATVATNLVSLPARGTRVLGYQQVDQTQPDGTVVPKWTLAATTVTDSNGKYSMTLTKDRNTMVEVHSSFSGGNGVVINLVAEPGGINSLTPVVNRLHYALRKAADGTSPVGTNTPNSKISANATVDFSVGLNDVWWVMNPEATSNGLVPYVDQAVLETTLTGRTAGQGSGSRILGIGDTIATFVTDYAAATVGFTLDLHYWPSRSESRGSYIEYNRDLYPQAFEPSAGRHRFFGSLQGGPVNDDAWDEGVIMPLLARNALYASNSSVFAVPQNPLFPSGSAQTDLSPEFARIEGLADAMAANALKSPYLADTQGASLVGYRDIRAIAGLSAAEKNPYSAPSIRAMAWEMILKANSLTTPGTATDWATINPLSAQRLFLAPSSTSTGANGIEPVSIYSQVARLKESKSGTEPVDLAAIFTDAVLTSVTAPYGVTWPRPSTGSFASFVGNWGTDPVGTLPPITLSMAKAAQVNMPYSVTPGVLAYHLAYPNLSEGEVVYSGFSLSVDKRCTLTAVISPALDAGNVIDLDLPLMNRTFSFTGTGGTTPVITIPMAGTAPFFHPVRLHLKSPTAIQPDVTVTLSLTPAP